MGFYFAFEERGIAFCTSLCATQPRTAPLLVCALGDDYGQGCKKKPLPFADAAADRRGSVPVERQGDRQLGRVRGLLDYELRLLRIVGDHVGSGQVKRRAFMLFVFEAEVYHVEI